MHQLIQIVGALLILAGFVAAQFRMLDPLSLPYLLVNLVGSAILTVDACSSWSGRSCRRGGCCSWPAGGRRPPRTECQAMISSSCRTENGSRQSSSASSSIVSRHS